MIQRRSIRNSFRVLAVAAILTPSTLLAGGPCDCVGCDAGACDGMSACDSGGCQVAGPPNGPIFHALEAVAGGIEKLMGFDKCPKTCGCDSMGCDSCDGAMMHEMSAPDLSRSRTDDSRSPPANIAPPTCPLARLRSIQHSTTPQYQNPAPVMPTVPPETYVPPTPMPQSLPMPVETPQACADSSKQKSASDANHRSRCRADASGSRTMEIQGWRTV